MPEHAACFSIHDLISKVEHRALGNDWMNSMVPAETFSLTEAREN